MGTQLRVRHLGRLISEWLTHYWIWVVAIMLMVISLGGTDVVLYRIAYMLLFLFFILVFQASGRRSSEATNMSGRPEGLGGPRSAAVAICCLTFSHSSCVSRFRTSCGSK